MKEKGNGVGEKRLLAEKENEMMDGLSEPLRVTFCACVSPLGKKGFSACLPACLACMVWPTLSHCW